MTLMTALESPIESDIRRLAPAVTVVTATESYGRFVIEPLSQGFGVTLGNAIRRVLLNSLPGMAITAVQIEGAQHEYSTLPGVREDMVDFLLNVKDIRIQSITGRSGVLRLEIGGRTGAITAGDIQPHGDYTVVNPELVLLHTDGPDAQLSVEFHVEQGTGFRAGGGQLEGPIGVLPVDAIFTPIRRANFEVEATRVGQVTDYDRLILEVWTDGALSAQDAVQRGTQIIVEQLAPFVALGQSGGEGDAQRSGSAVPDSLASVPVEDLQLSTRTQNSLRRGNLSTVGHVLERSAQELLGLRNFGEQSLNELVEKLRRIGVAVPEDGEDRAWRRMPLASLAPSSGQEAESGENAEDIPAGPAVYSMRPDDGVGEVDLTHFSQRSFGPEDDEDDSDEDKD